MEVRSCPKNLCQEIGKIDVFGNIKQLKDNYQGMVLSYQWLSKNDNAEILRKSLEGNMAGKIFLILDEVHHASSELAFGQACETAFPDNIVSHRLMTSGTPFRSDNNRILGNWVDYEYLDENVYQCIPNFRYTLADALSDEVIPVFSFVTMAGEFKYRRGAYEYDGITFPQATSEQQSNDLLNTAIYVDGGWVEEAIKWAHKRVKRDRAKGFPECAVYVRVPTIKAARKMKERIRSLTGEDALVVVSKDDDPSSSFSQRNDPSKLIEEFAAETGYSARSWIIGVGMLGEGVSIKRLKYRIHATNIRAPLSFMQDLGRLLRMFPDDNPEPVETLIPAHPDLINLALDVMNEVAHIVREREEQEESEESTHEGSGEGDGSPVTSSFQPLSSTGELASQIVDGEEISDEYTSVAEWAIANKEIWRHWGKTPAHLAQMLQEEKALFELLRQEFLANQTPNNHTNSSTEDVPDGFPSEYAGWLADEKKKFASSQAHKKAQHLAYVLYPNGTQGQIAEAIKEIHTVSKRRCQVSLSGHIGYQGWEKIYLWLIGRIAEAHRLKGTEDL